MSSSLTLGLMLFKWVNARRCVQMSSSGHVLLHGNGASPNGDRPFLDFMALDDGFMSTRKWRCVR